MTAALAFPTLNGAAIVLLVVVGGAWGRHRGRRAVGSLGMLTAAAVAVAYFAFVRSADIPLEWLTVLHYGSEESNITQVYARGAHTGPNFPALVEFVAAGTPTTLYDVVRMNLGLALVNLVAFLSIATHLQGGWWAIPWALVFCLNPATFLASFSELPSNLLHWYFLSGVVAWATLNDTEPQPRWVKILAALLLCLLTVLVASTRTEMAVTGIVALGVWTAHCLTGEAAWAAGEARARRALQAALAFLSRYKLVLLLLCLARGLISLLEPELNYRLGLALSALSPFNPHFLETFVLLPVIGLPVAVVLAVVAGSGLAAVHFRRFGGIVLSLIVLANTYYAAANGFYEALRYSSYFVGIVLLLGLFGRPAFDELCQRRAWPESWRQLVMVVYIMSWCMLPALGTLDPLLRPEYSRKGGFAQVLLDRNTQREARFLVAQTEKNPECVFVARAIQGHADPRVEPTWEYILFGKPIHEQPIIVRTPEAGLDAIISQYAAQASCVRLYYGDDCNLTFTDRCRDFVVDRRVVDEERFWSQPFNDPLQRGFAAPEVVLATYWWK